jgi:predicted phosphodiesterase
VRVMALGDTHGDSKWAVEATRAAGRVGCERILQVGDFGFWPRMMLTPYASHADFYLSQIEDACDDTGVLEWIFADGNHDDLQALADLTVAPDDDGLLRVGRNVRYAPRGASFTLDDVTFGVLGGAASIDAYLLEAGVDLGGAQPYERGVNWFPDLERPTQAEAARLPDHVDVLLTHEAPIEIDLRHLDGFPGIYISPEIQAITDYARHIVSVAMYRTTPRLLVHGHWHGKNRQCAGHGDYTCEVVGLASNSRRRGRDDRAWIILDLPDLTVKTIVNQ